MGHRHRFSTSQMHEGDHDQARNHMPEEEPYLHPTRAGTTENNSFFNPVESVSVDGMHSQWNSAPRSTQYALPSHIEVSHFQPDVSGRPHDSLLHLSNHVISGPAPQNHAQHASSSNYERQTFHNAIENSIDLTMGGGRGPHKRKSPGVPPVCERGSSSRYYATGSSSDPPIFPDLQHEELTVNSQHMPRNHLTMNPTHRGKDPFFSGEGYVRNVRSRSAFDLESNLAGNDLSCNPTINSYAIGHPINHSSSVDLSGQSTGALTQEWRNTSMPTAFGRIAVADTSSFSRGTNNLLVGSSSTNAASETGRYHHDQISSRNHVAPHGFYGDSSQSGRGIHSNFSHRSTPAFRASSSSRMGHVAPSDDGWQLDAKSYFSRQPRPLSSAGWRNGDISGRSRTPNDRYCSLYDGGGAHVRLACENLAIVDRPGVFGSRNVFDHHREMRLDVDSMSYEELLALGERIGSVSTGLSEDLVAKCLKVTIYYSSDQMQEDRNCVICLEEYNNTDSVGILKACGHDYHARCIKKWLSMKNVCPICKASALAGDMKEK